METHERHEIREKALLAYYDKYLLFDTPFGLAKPFFQDTCAGSGSAEELKALRCDTSMLGAWRTWLYYLGEYGRNKFTMVSDNESLMVRKGDICTFHTWEVVPVWREVEKKLFDKKCNERDKRLQDYVESLENGPETKP